MLIVLSRFSQLLQAQLCLCVVLGLISLDTFWLDKLWDWSGFLAQVAAQNKKNACVPGTFSLSLSVPHSPVFHVVVFYFLCPY